MIELKLDVDTLFEWQKHNQAATSIPPFQNILNFIDLRAQVSEASRTAPKKQLQPPKKPSYRAASFATNLEASSDCANCKTTKHSLYACSEFKAMSHDGRMQVLKVNRLCANCLGGGHFKSQCKYIFTGARCAKGLSTPCCTWTHHPGPIKSKALLRKTLPLDQDTVIGRTQ